VLVGLELTSRRGAAKLAEQRGRGAKSSYAASLAASGGAAWTVADSLAELARLCETARVRAVDATFQRADAANGQYLVGKGKIEEVAR
jgi:50S ribosomal subunit-associated GTPase HflX